MTIPLAQRPAGKRTRTLAPALGSILGTFQGKPAYSDNYMLVVGEAASKSWRRAIRDGYVETREADMESCLPAGNPEKITPEVFVPDLGGRYDAVRFSNGATVQARYFDIAYGLGTKKRDPVAWFGAGKNDPVIARRSEGIVAVIMPVQT